MKGFLRRFVAATRARSLEFLRDRSALGWNLAVPVILIAGLAFVFSGPGRPMFKVAVLAPASAKLDAALDPFLATPSVQFYRETDLHAAQHKLAMERIDMVLDLRQTPPRDWINGQSKKGALLSRILDGSTGVRPREQAIAGGTVRYVDWLAPGIFGMNMMFSCLFGIGYVIVRYRKNGYLKRLNATPLTALEFILAQLVSRLVLIVSITVAVFAATNAMLHFRMVGSYLDLLLVAVLGSVAMIALGLLVSARVTSEELAGGLLNLLTWPMMVLSGVFFSLDGAPHSLQVAAQFLPLTQLIEAARQIMLEGAGLRQIAGHLLVLTVMAVAFLALGAASFRWKQD